MAKNVLQNPFCPVVNCKTAKPHTDDPFVRGLLAYTPEVIARQALVGMTQLRDSMQDDLNGNRSFAFLTRFRQIEELFHRTIFYLFAATPEEIPHFLSEMPPNSFDSILKLLNQRLCDRRLTLDKHVIQTVGLPDQRLWKIMHETAHVSMRALQMAHDFRNSALQRQWLDTVVQRRVLVITNVLYALKRGDSLEQVRKYLVVPSVAA
ncbi:MAG TPA: hypothetical protein VK638_30380 [Edaphobacter sp.]|nr:hypothetical protein [Edaphobacter sp.]